MKEGCPSPLVSQRLARWTTLKRSASIDDEHLDGAINIAAYRSGDGEACVVTVAPALPRTHIQSSLNDFMTYI